MDGLIEAGVLGGVVALAMALVKVIEKLINKRDNVVRRRVDDECMVNVERNLERMSDVQARTVESLDRLARFSEDHRDRLHDLHVDIKDISRNVDAIRAKSDGH